MADKNITYEVIDNPYDNFLDRSDDQESPLISYEDDTNAGYDEYAGQDVLKTGKSFRDLTIDTWIKSRSFKPKKQGFYFDGKRGYIEAMFIRAGTIITDSEGARVQIGGAYNGDNVNDIWLFDDTVSSGGIVSGNVASIYFPRTDDTDPFNPVLSSAARFIIQRRKDSFSNDGNAAEIFFDQWPSAVGAENILYIGQRVGDTSSNTNIINVARRYIDFTINDGMSITGAFSMGKTYLSVVSNRSFLPLVCFEDVNITGNNLYFDNTHRMWWDSTATVYRVNTGSIYTPGDYYAGGTMVIEVADPATPGTGKVVAAGGGVGGSTSVVTSSAGVPAHTHTVPLNTVTLQINGSPYTLYCV